MAYTATHIEIDPDIHLTSFACDLRACKGACCTLPGGRGAPLLDEELDHIAAVLPVVLPTLSDEHRAAIGDHGPTEGSEGDHHTTCVNNSACVFVTYDGPIALCSIEQAYHRGEIAWRKPLSCHLFPIRVDTRPSLYARFEFIPQCLPAIHKGRAEKIPLVTFLSDALERAFGTSWSLSKERPTP